MARFVDFLLYSGKRDYPKNFYFSGVYDENHLSGDQLSLSLQEKKLVTV
jgi:hypothetical protein